jgi:phage gp45-like
MNRWEELAELRGHIADMVTQKLASLFGYTLTSNISALGDSDQVESADDAVDPDTMQKSQRPATRIQPFGFISRAPTGLRAMWLALGSSNVFFMGIGPQQKYGPQNLNDGETAVYAKPGQTFLLDENGNLIGTPAGSGTFQAGGNTYSMPQWDAFASAFATFIGSMSSTTLPIATLPQAAAALNTLIGAMNTLSAAMGSAGNYKSTLAKNG